MHKASDLCSFTLIGHTHSSFFRKLYLKESGIFYDFKTGKFSQTETDASIRFVAEIDSYDPESNAPYDWSITVSGDGLKFLLSETYTVVEAPEEGFGDELKLGFDQGSENWNGALDETVFFRTASGNYGYLRLGLTVRAKSDKVGILLSSYFNPSASPVLVFDPRKRIR